MKEKLGASPILFPMPAVLIGTYRDDGAANAMTAAWAAACCAKPPCLGVAVRDSRLTYETLRSRRAFTVCVPPAALVREVDYLGIVSGKRAPDKLERAGLDSERGSEVDAPALLGCPVVAECELRGELELGSHTWFAGEVKQVQVDRELLREDGTIDVQRLDPLGYATSERLYRRVGEALGSAYSIGRALDEDTSGE